MRRMPRRSCGVAALLLVIVAAVQPTAASGAPHSSVTASAAFLVDDQTGEILWQHNPDLQLPPASTTKVMTAILALQSGRLNDSLVVSSEAAQAPPSKISLRPGWSMRLHDLVYAVLLNSANDASVVIAQGLAGSVPEFARRMNAKALLLGARNTHFVNPNGLPADDHYTTARDLATIFNHAMRDPLFVRIVSTINGEVYPTSGSHRRINLHTHNRLLGNYRIHVVGKTGWTVAARKCFVGSATANGRQLTVAVLGSRNLWGDVKTLLEYGFDGASQPGTAPAELLMASSSGVSTGGGDAVEPSRRLPDTTYSVRLGAFRNFSSATQLQNLVARKGYPARIEKLRRRRRAMYRVAVGQYADRRDAQRAAQNLKRTHRVTALVVAGG